MYECIVSSSYKHNHSSLIKIVIYSRFVDSKFKDFEFDPPDSELKRLDLAHCE